MLSTRPTEGELDLDRKIAAHKGSLAGAWNEVGEVNRDVRSSSGRPPPIALVN
jgi:hypothetical protein